MNKNVCIIHFNTPVLTAHLVKSINKHTPGTNIYIFDNSDKRPFVNNFNNVTVFDNTKGQIINFDQWLKKYPNRNRSGGKANNWGSAKHAYSVEKCMELIKEPFVLFDSDVLVKRDFSSLFDEVVCYKGEVIFQPKSKVKRVLPFICFINTPLCKEKGVHYFDENYMHGLSVGSIGDRYDTGAALYLLTEKKNAPHREIKVADFIVHYGNGSWVDAAEKMKKPKHIPAMEWINKYKDFWSDGIEPVKPEKVSFSDVFDHIYCLHYLPNSDRLPKLKDELKRVEIDETADYFSWVYDYPSGVLDMLFKSDKLKMDVALRASSRDYVKKVSLKHYEIIKEAYALGYGRILVLEDDIRFHKDKEFINRMLVNIPSSNVVMFDKMVCSSQKDEFKYKDYVKKLPEGTLYGNMRDAGVFFIFCSCYSLDRTGMERVIKLHEGTLLPPDTPFNDKAITGSFAITNVAIQEPNLKTRSSELYSRIGLDTNMYATSQVQAIETKKDEPKKPENKPAKPLPSVNKPVQADRTIIRGGGLEHKKEPIKPKTLAQVKRPETKKPALPDKAIRNHTRPIHAKTVGHNKLYDVY